MTNELSVADVALRANPRLVAVALALWARAEGEALAGELSAAGVRVMVLKGPQLQERLYGDPATYVSSDVDVLVRPADSGRCRQVLRRNGWTFEPENGVLWFLSSAASYVREGFRADVHWGMHAAHLPSFTLRPLERALWERAERDDDGFWRPDDESLFVFLAVHVVGHGFERPQWVTNVYRAGDRVRDWPRVWQIARSAKVEGAVRAAMQEQAPGTSVPVLDGLLGRSVWWLSYVLRGHVVPVAARDRVRELFAMRREGFGLRSGPSAAIEFQGLRLRLDHGVFEPQEISAQLIDVARAALGHRSPDVVIDVGTGSGAVALLAATTWPSAHVHGVDASARAVSCARRNARSAGLEATFSRGDLLDPVPTRLQGRADVVVSNVPYVSPAVGRDVGDWSVPSSTVFGPEHDGLGLMRRLGRSIPEMLAPHGVWVFQIGDSQWEAWDAHLRDIGYETIAPAERRLGSAVVGAARWGG